jgi:hypothetical protein
MLKNDLQRENALKEEFLLQPCISVNMVTPIVTVSQEICSELRVSLLLQLKLYLNKSDSWHNSKVPYFVQGQLQHIIRSNP